MLLLLLLLLLLLNWLEIVKANVLRVVLKGGLLLLVSRVGRQ